VIGRYDREVSETLTSLGVTPGLVVGGPGPAMLRRVVAERASAIGTASCAGDGAGLTVGRLSRSAGCGSGWCGARR
jgi:hypothetical protein